MTPEERAEIRSACEKATPGPWEVRDLGDETCAVCDRDRGSFAYLSDEYLPDAELIAKSRTWVPTLLDECERLRAALERALHNFELMLAHSPVRDATETLAEAHAALGEDSRD